MTALGDDRFLLPLADARVELGRPDLDEGELRGDEKAVQGDEEDGDGEAEHGPAVVSRPVRPDG